MNALAAAKFPGITYRLQHDAVARLAPRQPVVVAPDTTVGEVLGLLVAHSIGCVVVVRDGNVAGIFSERDALLRLNVDYAALLDRPIECFMTPRPDTVDMSTSIAGVILAMDKAGVRHLPVCDDSRLVGVVSVRDVLDYLTAHLIKID